MASNIDRRLQALEQRMRPARDAYRPEWVMACVSTRYAVRMVHPSEEELTATEWREQREQGELARQTTIDQVVEWVTDDARAHGWVESYGLILAFPDADERPGAGRFTLPWRGPQLSVAQKVFGDLGIGSTPPAGMLEWPNVPAHDVLEWIPERPARAAEPIREQPVKRSTAMVGSVVEAAPIAPEPVRTLPIEPTVETELERRARETRAKADAAHAEYERLLAEQEAKKHPKPPMVEPPEPVADPRTQPALSVAQMIVRGLEDERARHRHNLDI